jgi:hypothetical protein
MYDNAAMMSGHVNGEQTRLMKKTRKLRSSIVSDNHSLNFAALNAASVDPTIVTRFGTIEKVCVFLSSSARRQKRMKDNVIPKTVKRRSLTLAGVPGNL